MLKENERPERNMPDVDADFDDDGHGSDDRPATDLGDGNRWIRPVKEEE